MDWSEAFTTLVIQFAVSKWENELFHKYNRSSAFWFLIKLPLPRVHRRNQHARKRILERKYPPEMVIYLHAHSHSNFLSSRCEELKSVHKISVLCCLLKPRAPHSINCEGNFFLFLKQKKNCRRHFEIRVSARFIVSGKRVLLTLNGSFTFFYFWLRHIHLFAKAGKFQRPTKNDDDGRQWKIVDALEFSNLKINQLNEEFMALFVLFEVSETKNLWWKSFPTASHHKNDEFGDILRIYFLCHDEVYLLPRKSEEFSYSSSC